MLIIGLRGVIWPEAKHRFHFLDALIEAFPVFLPGGRSFPGFVLVYKPAEQDVVPIWNFPLACCFIQFFLSCLRPVMSIFAELAET